MSLSDNTLKYLNPQTKITSFEHLEHLLNDPTCFSLCLKSSFDLIKEKLDFIFKNNIYGDIVLTGVWKGGLASYIQSLLVENNNTHRNLYLSDTFNGFLPVNSIHKKDKKMAEYFSRLKAPTGNIVDIKKLFHKLSLPLDNVVFLEGDLKHTTQNLNINISLLIIDVDFFEPTLNALNNLYSSVVKNGFVYIDDYNVNEYECKQAVDDFIMQNNLNIKLMPINEYAIYWQKTNS